MYHLLQKTIGIHPASSLLVTKNVNWESDFRDLVVHQKPVAIGECGLDRVIQISPRIQKWVFCSQILLAKELRIPLVVHERGTFEDTLELLLKYGGQSLRIHYHCFQGDLSKAKRLLKEFNTVKIGISPKIFKDKVLQDTVKELKLSDILLESDFPYICKTDPRSEIINIAALIGSIKGKTTLQVLRQCNTNCSNFYSVQSDNATKEWEVMNQDQWIKAKREERIPPLAYSEERFLLKNKEQSMSKKKQNVVFHIARDNIEDDDDDINITKYEETLNKPTEVLDLVEDEQKLEQFTLESWWAQPKRWKPSFPSETWNATVKQICAFYKIKDIALKPNRTFTSYEQFDKAMSPMIERLNPTKGFVALYKWKKAKWLQTLDPVPITYGSTDIRYR